VTRRHSHLHRTTRRRRSGTPGEVPGTLSRRTDASASHAVVRKFTDDVYEEAPLATADALTSVLDPSCSIWIDVTGLADTSLVASIGQAFGLHELSLEDALDPIQRAKVEHYDHYTFVVMKTLAMSEFVETHHLSIFLGDRFVVTLQDIDNPALEPIRQRLRHGHGKIRGGGADYLTYALIDTVIDHYFPVVEAFDDRLERAEDAVLEAKGVDPIDLARKARQDLQTIRHAIWPARDAVASLLRDEAPRVHDETRVHLRDCYDHIIQLQEMVESSREISASLLEAYISRVSLGTNEVMKVLTVIATIFIPLTFITGLYGMNFNPGSSPLNMPELNWYWGYPFALLLMAGAVGVSLLYFRRKGWFGSRNGRTPSSGGRE